MASWYRSGTVQVTQGSPNLVFVGTLLTVQASTGDIFIGPDLNFYEITSIADDLHATIRQLNGTMAYASASAMAQPYAIIRNFTSTLPAQLASQLAALMTNYHVTLDELTAWLSGAGVVTLHDAVGNAYAVNTPTQLSSQVAQEIANLETWKANASALFPLPPNLITNAFMTNVANGVPVGFSAAGCQIQAVHPFTKGFEGPYCSAVPAGAVSDPNQATQSNPYWYGVYYKGPRLSRGGLGDGWGGIGNGSILKITASPDPSRSWTTVWFPIPRLTAIDRIGFKGFIKFAQGSAAAFGTDSGISGSPQGYQVTNTQAAAAPQGWLPLNFIQGTSQVVSTGNNNFCLGFRRDEPVEVYLAMPYAYIPAGAAPGILAE